MVELNDTAMTKKQSRPRCWQDGGIHWGRLLGIIAFGELGNGDSVLLTLHTFPGLPGNLAQQSFIPAIRMKASFLFKLSHKRKPQGVRSCESPILV